MEGEGRFQLRPVTDGDYGYVISRLDEWWGGEREMTAMLPRLFFTHFASTTTIAADPRSGTPLGFLCGFRSATDPSIAYIHFVGVDPDARGTGVGRSMYEWFFRQALAMGCTAVECVTSPLNTGSRAFHAAMGFSERSADDYDGPGEDRVRFRRELVENERPATSEYESANMAFWNSAAPLHARSPDYGLQRFVDDPDHISDVVRFDLPRLGDISGLRAVHLQCHIGTDTVSLARLGATMTGLDLSEESLAAARRLATEAGAEIEFVQSHTFDALDVLEPDCFDLVYTGVGAINWLPEIRRWADVVAGLLRPGGRLFIREGHPIVWTLPDSRPDGLLTIDYPYFETEGVAFGSVGTYVETDEDLGFLWTVEFNHGIGEIITALLDVGMEITGFVEHDSLPWVAIDGQMEPIGGGEFRLIDRPERLPHSYTLQARKR